jgi:hypothetical protein
MNATRADASVFFLCVRERVSPFVYSSSYRYYRHAFLPFEFDQWTWFDEAAIVFLFFFICLSIYSTLVDVSE